MSLTKHSSPCKSCKLHTFSCSVLAYRWYSAKVTRNTSENLGAFNSLIGLVAHDPVMLGTTATLMQLWTDIFIYICIQSIYSNDNFMKDFTFKKKNEHKFLLLFFHDNKGLQHALKYAKGYLFKVAKGSTMQLYFVFKEMHFSKTW